MSPKASGSSSERPITSASDGEFTIFLFPDRGVWFAGPAKMIFATAPAGGRYPQLAVDPTQSDAHGRLGEDRRARGHGSLLCRCRAQRSPALRVEPNYFPVRIEPRAARV